MNGEKVQIKTPEYVSLQFQTAGLGSRGAASIIDYTMITVVSFVIFLIVIFVTEGQTSLGLFEGASTVPIAIAIILIFLLFWGYFFVFEYFSGGRTIGKMLMGIRVIQDNGHSLTLLSSFIRNLLRIIDMLPVYYFIGMLMIFLNSKHKRIGDLVAGTIVVHERKAKRRKKISPLMKEIEQRNLSKNDLVLDEGSIKAMGMKEWKLVKTYSERLLQLSAADRSELTKQISGLILPKIGMDVIGKTDYDLENILLVLFIILQEEWEFEV